MARLVCGMALGVVIGVFAGAAAGLRADEDEVAAAATEAGVDELALRGALNSVRLVFGPIEPREYLYSTGELKRPPPAVPTALERRADCIIARESRGNPNAVNRSSGASGLGQFLPSTWRTTPYAGYSIFNAWANRQAVIWMLSVGRGREFATIGGC